MKRMKKLFALLLSVVMVMGLSLTAFAGGDTYTITINNSAEGHTYEAYQIFTGDLSSDGKTLSNIKWGSGVTEEGKTALGDASAKAEKIINESDAKAFAKAVASYLNTPAGSASTVTDSKYVITVTEPGYYLIKDKDNSLAGKENEAYTSYILEVVHSITVDPKSDTPESEKNVKDVNDSTGETSEWQESADYDIGDKVPFQLKATLPTNYDSYTKYQLTFHDVESEGLTFYSNSVKVYVDGKLIENGYEVVTSELNDGCTFEVKFPDVKSIKSATAGSVITVEYQSVLNEKAVKGSAGNQNTMHITYSNNPNDTSGGETGTTPDDTAIVFTYQTIINKVDSEGNTLTGADFTLEKYNEETDEWKAIAVVKNNDCTTFTFSGLDDGQYRLTETTTPDGHNTIDPIYFVIEATHGTEGLTVLTASQTDKSGKKLTNNNDITATFNADLGLGSLSTDIVNKPGSTLPSTGGMGTTIIYVVGIILVIGAAVILVVRRRMRTQ